MSAVRGPAIERDCLESLAITDADGDVLEVESIAPGSADGRRGVAALMTMRREIVEIDHADGLELLSFLAAALGVEGTEPGEPTP